MAKTFSINIGKRVRRRRNAAGQIVNQSRYVLNFNDPKTGARRQLFFTKRQDAEAARNEIVSAVESGSYIDRRTAPTITQAVGHWIENRRGQVKDGTLRGYETVTAVIVGPLPRGTASEKAAYTRQKGSGEADTEIELIPMLGDVLTTDITTARIRQWHNLVKEEVGHYTANRAKSILKSVLALAEEDFGVRAASMPTNLARRSGRPKKTILSPEQIGSILASARGDREKGIYYAFPFLTGTRASEQLGLLWEDVDFEQNVIRIRRIQERDGSLCETTKTDAGRRDVPMMSVLREMLLEWRLSCPRLNGELHRVFPAPGRRQAWPAYPRVGGGGPLLYQNFRRRYWEPVFEQHQLPYVTLHSARHSFISIMQAEGVEVGLVAKIAGHSNAAITLSHYTQAVRGAGAAVEALQRGFGLG